MQVASYSDLRNNLKDYFDAVVDDNDTVIINRTKGKAVVLISLEEYNAIKETEYLMSSKKMMEAIRKGEEELKNGAGIEQMDGESIL
ncbi:MAG: type II toxin-antitoxin system prevent-host-death family antitoxin [Tannerella sp.]|jgi:antitoxin YefM|nr:type II toxin-antitoxin system prevent-host-death family antitoxin [Tannerella sp.]